MNWISAVCTLILLGSSAHAGFLSPDPKRSYSPRDLEVLAHQGLAAVRAGDAFVVEDGFIFHLSPDRAPKWVRQSYGVKTVLLYRDKLVAMDARGTVSLLGEERGPGKGPWFQIAASAVKIMTDGLDLFAMIQRRVWTGLFVTDTHLERKISVYKGTPGSPIWTYMPVTMPMAYGGFMSFNTMLVPFLAGHQVSFEDKNIADVADLIEEHGKVVAVTGSGGKIELSRE